MTMTGRLHSVGADELDELRARDDVPEDFYDDPEADLDGAWDVITQVLRVGGSNVAAAAILGGTPFGEDQGYGPPRTFTPEQVARVAGELAKIGEDDFRRSFAEADLSEAYGGESADVESALDAFLEVRDCYQSAAAEGRAMALFI